jgi:DNA repair exonuclease SbcCD ATPase subunit
MAGLKRATEKVNEIKEFIWSIKEIVFVVAPLVAFAVTHAKSVADAAVESLSDRIAVIIDAKFEEKERFDSRRDSAMVEIMTRIMVGNRIKIDSLSYEVEDLKESKTALWKNVSQIRSKVDEDTFVNEYQRELVKMRLRLAEQEREAEKTKEREENLKRIFEQTMKEIEEAKHGDRTP